MPDFSRAPVPTYGSTWVVLWLLFFRSAPPIGVRFRESLVIRLHSEIDQIHISIEAQCVTTLLPLGDCHTEHKKIKSTRNNNIVNM